MKHTPEEGQGMMDEVRAKWPDQVAELYILIESKIKLFNSFQLIANISHYNHVHDTKRYTDYREDRMFVVPLLNVIPHFIGAHTRFIHR